MIRLRRNIKSVHNGRLKKGDDFLLEITSMVISNNIHNGYIGAIGAVSELNLGYYNQIFKKYETKNFINPMEIINISGNISKKNEEYLVHAHGIFSSHDYTTIGGHLNIGCIVFACEYTILEFDGNEFIRSFDDETGLYLYEVGK